jgi:hypothetical protein
MTAKHRPSTLVAALAWVSVLGCGREASLDEPAPIAQHGLSDDDLHVMAGLPIPTKTGDHACAAADAGVAELPEISDEELRAISTRPISSREFNTTGFGGCLIGRHDNAAIRVEIRCRDVCPDQSMRIVRIAYPQFSPSFHPAYRLDRAKLHARNEFGCGYSDIVAVPRPDLSPGTEDVDACGHVARYTCTPLPPKPHMNNGSMCTRVPTD